MPKFKLDAERVSRMIWMWRMGATASELARTFGIATSTVSGIVAGHSWQSFTGALRVPRAKSEAERSRILDSSMGLWTHMLAVPPDERPSDATLDRFMEDDELARRMSGMILSRSPGLGYGGMDRAGGWPMTTMLREVRDCIAWLRPWAVAKTAQAHSYSVKHRVEADCGRYVSNGSLILAAAILRIPMRKGGLNPLSVRGPNVWMHLARSAERQPSKAGRGSRKHRTK